MSKQVAKLLALNESGSVYDKPLALELPSNAAALFARKEADIHAALAHYEAEVIGLRREGKLGGKILSGILTKLISTLFGSLSGGAVTPPGGGTTPPTDPAVTSVIVAAVMDFVNKVLLPMLSNGAWGGGVWGPILTGLIKLFLPTLLEGFVGAIDDIGKAPAGGTTPTTDPLPDGFVPY